MALHEIRKFQKPTGFLIQKLPSLWWVQIVVQEYHGNLHFWATAFLNLEEVAEAYAVNLFEDANLCAVHAKHITVIPKDT